VPRRSGTVPGPSRDPFWLGDTLQPSTATPATPAPRPAEAGLRDLLIVRFLTVVNDNVARWLTIGVGKRAGLAVGTSPDAVLAVGMVAYVLPFILFAWLAGWLADRFAKRSVVVWSKFGEIAIAVTAAAAIGYGVVRGRPTAGLPGGLWLLMGAVALYAFQTTLLNPSMLGTIPETVARSRLAAANGVFAMVSLVASMAGMAVGSGLADRAWLSPVPDPSRPVAPWLAALPFGHALPAAVTMTGLAVAGWLASLRLPRVPAADPRAAPPWNALAVTAGDVVRLVRSPRLAAAAGGIVFFWALAAVAQLNVDRYKDESGGTTQGEGIPLLVALVIGIGVGSLVAGRLSRRSVDPGSKVDLGFVPLGALIMAGAEAALALSGTDVFGGAGGSLRIVPPVVWLALLGIGAGMFDVPLEAYLQEQSPPARRGAVLAATNLLVFTGMLAASVAYYGLRMPIGAGDAVRPLVSARGVFGIFAGLSLAAMGIAIWCAPRASLRLLVATFVNSFWRLRVHDDGRMPEQGPAVLVANHLSWLDGFLLPLTCPRPVRMVVFGPNIRGRFLRMLADQWRFILFDPRPKSIGRALKTIQSGLADGDVIGIFCEGGISRNGHILGFKRGLDWLLTRVDASIVPLFIDGLWGSRLSFSEGRYFTKLRQWQRRGGPARLRRTITMCYGSPLPIGTRPAQARLALQDLGAHAIRRRLAGIRLDGLPVSIDATAAAAEAEAFDAACLVRRGDHLLCSLAPGDPLHATLGTHGGRLLRIPCTVVDPGLPTDRLLAELLATRATLWLARPEQVRAVAAEDGCRGLEGRLQGVVVPLAHAAALATFEQAAAAFRDAVGIEPVVAFAPAEAGGLVAMNTPPARAGAAHESTCKPGSLGRVLNGAVVWPHGPERWRLGVQPTLAEAMKPAADRTLLVAATIPRPGAADADLPGAVFLDAALAVDDDGFLEPPSPEA
jgi:1-acyl-sn-glycerol-3-phosphate acyltransferase